MSEHHVDAAKVDESEEVFEALLQNLDVDAGVRGVALVTCPRFLIH